MGHNVVEQNKRLVFIFIFITISEAYQTPGGKIQNFKYKMQIKQYFRCHIKTAKYGAPAEKKAL